MSEFLYLPGFLSTAVHWRSDERTNRYHCAATGADAGLVLRGHRWRRYLGWQQWLALGVGLLVYILPFLYASITSADYSSNGIALVVRENIQRFFNPFDHIEPFYIYLKHVPVLFLPWSPLLVIALIMAIRHCRRGCSNQYDRWLMWAMLLIFLFFSASGSRRSYYILPILPFCALFCSVWMLKLESHPAGQRWLTKPYIWLSGLIFIAVPAAAATLAAVSVASRIAPSHQHKTSRRVGRDAAAGSLATLAGDE
jgi:4-amino-4-deoxy-L-arabinose transferase-like glycosyltransferase